MSGTDPDWVNLTDGLGAATRVVVVEAETSDPGNRCRNRPVLVVVDADGIDELVRFLRGGVDCSGDDAVMEPVAHTMVFLRDRAVMARFGLVGNGRWIRDEGGDRRMWTTIPLARWFKRWTRVDAEVLRRGEAWFEPYAKFAGPLLTDAAGGPYTCPCCGHSTLAQRAGFEICRECWWEDDGQDEHDSHIVLGGLNGADSLDDARASYVRRRRVPQSHRLPFWSMR